MFVWVYVLLKLMLGLFIFLLMCLKDWNIQMSSVLTDCPVLSLIQIAVWTEPPPLNNINCIGFHDITGFSSQEPFMCL